jgi:hypothetical protein
MNPPSIGNAVYGGLATYGKINVIMGSIVTGIIVIILLIVGISLYFQKNTRIRKTSGTIFNINSANSTFGIRYTVNNKEYAIQGSGKNVLNDQSVDVLYDPNDPSNARPANQMSSKTFGGILIVIGLVLGVTTGLSLYFTFKYKEYAAIEGGFTAAGQIKNLM